MTRFWFVLAVAATMLVGCGSRDAGSPPNGASSAADTGSSTAPPAQVTESQAPPANNGDASATKPDVVACNLLDIGMATFLANDAPPLSYQVARSPDRHNEACHIKSAAGSGWLVVDCKFGAEPYNIYTNPLPGSKYRAFYYNKRAVVRLKDGCHLDAARNGGPDYVLTTDQVKYLASVMDRAYEKEEALAAHPPI